MTDPIVCLECRGALRSPIAIETRTCGSCFRRLGAAPTRRADGTHDCDRCRCGPCNDLAQGFRQDAAWDAGDGEGVE